MKLHTILLCALGVLASTSAHAVMPSSEGKGKAVLTVTQQVGTNNSVSLSAKVVPLMNSNQGFGAPVLQTQVRNPSAIVAVPALPLSGNSQSGAIAYATSHFKANGETYGLQMRTWMRANGISFAWFTYEQTFTINVPKLSSTGYSGSAGGGGGGSHYTYNSMLSAVDKVQDGGGGAGGSTGGLASGTEERILQWTMTTDQNGRTMFGNPRIIPPKPRALYVKYIPNQADDSLPTNYKYDHAGQVFIQERSANDFNVIIPGTDEYRNVSGFFDDTDDNQLAHVACLVRADGCSPPLTVKAIMSERGATIAIVDYVTKLEAVNKATGVPGEYVPDVKITVTKRVLDVNNRCTGAVLTNEGTRQYRLSSSYNRYMVSMDGQYMPLGEQTSDSADYLDKDNYSGTLTVDPKYFSEIENYIINPARPDSGELVKVDDLVAVCGAANNQCLTVNPVQYGSFQNTLIYSTTGYVATGNNRLSTHVYVGCNLAKNIIEFSAGWQDNGSNVSQNWTTQVNRYTVGTTFTRGVPGARSVSSTEEPSLHGPCYGTAYYDGGASITLNMSTGCAYGDKLVFGNFSGDAADPYVHDGLESLFGQYCASGSIAWASGDMWNRTSYGGDNGDQVLLTPTSKRGCVYDSRSGLRVLTSELLYYGPTAGGTSGFGAQDRTTWGWTGICPNAADTPLFGGLEGVSYGDSGSETYYTTRVCVARPQSTWRISW